MNWAPKCWLVTGLGFAVAALGGCAAANTADERARPAVPAVESPTVGAAPAEVPVAPAEMGFESFLAQVRADALAAGLRPATLNAALSGARHLDRVIELDRRQPEFTLTFRTYLDRIVTPDRVAEGRRRLAENGALLKEIERRYGVPARVAVALWGIETGFGRNMGGMPVVSSLATLAYDGRRAAYFRTELMNALTILDQGHISAPAMVGSWAGAMGQCQFMPSTFLKFAVDWDGDGRRDIWTNRADALASAANYLSAEGWDAATGWGRAVRLPRTLTAAQIGLDRVRTLEEWSRLGVRAADGGPLPQKTLRAAIVIAESPKGSGVGPAFLVYDNFRTLMKWNRSIFFALAAGHLADRIGGS